MRSDTGGWQRTCHIGEKLSKENPIDLGWMTEFDWFREDDKHSGCRVLQRNLLYDDIVGFSVTSERWITVTIRT
jgi:hypothetical protein